MARLGTLEGEQRSLQKQNAGLAADADRVRASLTEKDRAYEELQQRNRALVIENESLAKKLAGSGAKVAASAAEREQLARKLAVTGKGLEEARSRAAQLNSSYEALLKEQKKRAASDAARDAELERTKKALEAAQEEVARLTGARGIYTVQTGDHLSKIAAFFYHKAHRWPDIFEANSFLISSPDLIYPQQVLIIPR
ncbi:MAG: LysM peptidoglycan-binding domain-containing protein [Betaproteobacteria bacterium]|nr:LysM peptidoglycan-binding domain-containing protein [Betaproteobacteria bacterium]